MNEKVVLLERSGGADLGQNSGKVFQQKDELTEKALGWK